LATGLPGKINWTVAASGCRRSKGSKKYNAPKTGATGCERKFRSIADLLNLSDGLLQTLCAEVSRGEQIASDIWPDARRQIALFHCELSERKAHPVCIKIGLGNFNRLTVQQDSNQTSNEAETDQTTTHHSHHPFADALGREAGGTFGQRRVVQAWRPNPEPGAAIPTIRQGGPVNWNAGEGNFYLTVASSPASSGYGYSMTDGRSGAAGWTSTPGGRERTPLASKPMPASRRRGFPTTPARL
jgi:hypothetical protein